MSPKEKRWRKEFFKSLVAEVEVHLGNGSEFVYPEGKEQRHPLHTSWLMEAIALLEAVGEMPSGYDVTAHKPTRGGKS